MNSTEVTVIMTNYNAEKYIEETIVSILNQTYTNFELIIVDDCSTDSSLKIIREYENNFKNIKILELKKNQGKGFALAKGLENVSGKYLAFIDSDDLWEPEKLQKQIVYMKKEKLNFTFTSYIKFNIGRDTRKRIYALPKVDYNKMLQYSNIGYSTVIIHVDLLKDITIPIIRKRQDYALWLCLLKKEVAYGLDDPLTLYRVREDSLSKNKFELIKWNWIVYRKYEKLSIIQSVWYLMGDVYSKMFKKK